MYLLFLSFTSSISSWSTLSVSIEGLLKNNDSLNSLTRYTILHMLTKYSLNWYSILRLSKTDKSFNTIKNILTIPWTFLWYNLSEMVAPYKSDFWKQFLLSRGSPSLKLWICSKGNLKVWNAKKTTYSITSSLYFLTPSRGSSSINIYTIHQVIWKYLHQ